MYELMLFYPISFYRIIWSRGENTMQRPGWKGQILPQQVQHWREVSEQEEMSMRKAMPPDLQLLLIHQFFNCNDSPTVFG